MSSISISPWRRKLGHNPRFSIYDGRERLGSIFESNGVFTAIDADGRLVIGSTSLQIAPQFSHFPLSSFENARTLSTNIYW
jgi:hypothetical protein